MIFEASAPANIALIKYMGKSDSSLNLPANSSLSLTLENLRSFVTLEESREESREDAWRPLVKDGLVPLQLNLKGQERFLQHLKNLKKHFGVEASFLVSSANNFPSDCGLASSASSFAALTIAAASAFKETRTSIAELAELSRKGSGSSCRSFFAPLAIWDAKGARPADVDLGDVFHQVVIVEAMKKEVSSSQAHVRVNSSLLFHGRPERAEKRLRLLTKALANKNWQESFEIVWAEFWDMHSLFETSHPSFGYLQAGSIEVLRMVREFWNLHGDGPLATMDAGANVHLIWRRDQQKLASQLASGFLNRFSVYPDDIRGRP